MKRLFDLIASLFGLIIFLPVLLSVMLLVWINDFGNPFYIANRVGKDGKIFKMYKLRSMVVNADKSGIDSTSNNDMRITKVGKFIRKFKLDELSQLINVFMGDMSIVGPRPNVEREVNLYTKDEMKLITLRPGITDFASIVFSDEGEILQDKKDPDLSYNQLIRPWKSRLGLFYIDKQSFSLDIRLIFITGVAIINKTKALRKLNQLLIKNGANKQLVKVASREDSLEPFPPPGSKTIVSNR